MENLAPKALKREAQRRLDSAAFNPRYLILLNTGVTVGLGLLVNGLNYLLSHQIGATGGLGGLGMRSVLQTVQTLLSYVASLFTPFWAAGLLFCFIGIVRNQEVTPGSMLAGFRRFPKLLSFSLFELLAIMLLIMPIVYISTAIYMFTPLSNSFMSSLEQLLNSGALATSGGMLDSSTIPPEIMLQGTLPLMLIMMVIAVPAFLFLSYSLHMGPYLIMTDSVRGGFQALVTSLRLMRGNRRKLFKLDLSYWWFYVLEGLAVCVLYLDMIFTMFGITPPMNATVFYFLLLVIYSAIELGLHYWKKAERDTAFVLLYEQIATPADPGNDIILP